MSDRHPPQDLGTCAECGKVSYRSRADARRASNRHGSRRRAYRCGDFGHLASYKKWADVAFFRRVGL